TVSGAVLVIRIVPIFSLIPIQVVACRRRVGTPRVDALPDNALVPHVLRYCPTTRRLEPEQASKYHRIQNLCCTY
ncbi:hypothetical protein JB92DRAFT_2989025, partial [Gautieria morchelliformis]